jgi:hypothetical protein
MVTKEQALTCTSFIQVFALCDNYTMSIKEIKPINWRTNGKCKTWKRSPDRFQLPIKHGLYNYGYITEENAHLFEVVC